MSKTLRRPATANWRPNGEKAMNEDTIKDIINDARDLALDTKDTALLRYGLERIAERLEELTRGGLYVTPKAALDSVLDSHALGESPAESAEGAEPEPENERKMSRIEAISIICRLAVSRKRTADEVTALQMGARYLLKKHFERQRNWAKRRAADKEAE